MNMMTEERGTRDPRFEDAVEGDDASGAASPFDGNLTSDIVSWLFANETWTDSGFHDSTLPKLMYHTAMGHLAWVVFPRAGFRL